MVNYSLLHSLYLKVMDWSLCFDFQKHFSLYFHYIQSMADISIADISKVRLDGYIITHFRRTGDEPNPLSDSRVRI